MPLKRILCSSAAIVTAAGFSLLGAWWASAAIEDQSITAVKSRLLDEGITWASVTADGLQVLLSGTAPNEAARFRVVNLVGSVVQSSRVRDGLEVAAVRAVEAPRFSIEMLRNDDGISLIGLLPLEVGEAALTETVAGLSRGTEVADMLETADYPAPENWQASLDYGLEALKVLPRSKISVEAGKVTITAISTSAEEKRKLVTDLARRVPSGVEARIDISAPRPVLTPFTLRFVKDEAGARFDACSADTTRARDRIVKAGAAAGILGKTACTVGLGVPTPRWADAGEAGIRAVAALGAGTVTFSDADVTLLAAPETDQA
ncbi:MAG: BON domain-containing protein, partial [Paracoccaceae bacterium]|nr:BON domain-containing protein [Paracoccaceae bacterium]